ncbi:MAG TPA: hypothetical protein VGC24_11800 [Burkholderiaceae bacterium]
MNASAIAANPFALMVQPEQVLRAMAQSQALRGLRQRQCRPLDREEDAVKPDNVDKNEGPPWLRGMSQSQMALYRAVLR